MRHLLTTTGRGLLMAEALAVLLLAVAAVALFPWVEAVKIVLAMTVAYGVARWMFGRSVCHSTAGRVVLLVSAVLLVSLAVLFLYDTTVGSGASFEMPNLSADPANYYNGAMHLYDGTSVSFKMTFWGYSWIIVGLWKVLGKSVIWPVAANVMVALITIVMAGIMAARISWRQRPGVVAAVAMALLAVQGHFMSQSAQMLREPWAYLSITLMAYALIPRSRSRGGQGGDLRSRVLIYLVGCLLLAAIRAKFVNFMFLGVLMMAMADLKHWRQYATLLALTVGCWCLGMVMAQDYTVAQQVNNVTGQGGMETQFAAQGAYGRLTAEYFGHPVWKKLLLLPVTFATQWVIPFPWPPEGSHNSLLGMVPRMQWGWYVVSGAVAYFYLFCSFKRRKPWVAWAWVPMLCVAGIAYITAGTVSRYLLSFMPWMVSLAALPVSEVLSGTSVRSRRLVWFMAAYVLLLGATLAVARSLV